jgi:hypothetical protein
MFARPPCFTFTINTLTKLIIFEDLLSSAISIMYLFGKIGDSAAFKETVGGWPVQRLQPTAHRLHSLLKMFRWLMRT